MKTLVVVALFAVLTVAWARPDEKYTDQYDDFDVDEALKNKFLVNNYVGCINTGVKCTPEGSKLKEVLPDALQTACKKCTAVQKEKGEKVLKILAEKYPEQFLEIEKVHDPDRKWRKRYAKDLEERHIVLPD